MSRSLLLPLLLLLACSLQTSQLMAQGKSIPKSSKAQEKTDALLVEELPEGQTHRYPLFNGLNVSVDIFDPICSLFLYDHASYEAQVMVDLHHRFFPMASIGMGYAKETSNNGIEFSTGQKQEFTYKSGMAPFMKLGMGYNLRYNNIKPNDYYMIIARYGIAHNTADLTNLYYASLNWDDPHLPDLLDQSYTTQWIEAGVALKVQIIKHVSLGWDLYAKIKLTQSGTQYGKPAFVPGFGDNNSIIGFNFRIYYDIF